MSAQNTTGQRAIISVSDKSGIAEFAQGLHRCGFEIISTGGTAGFIRGQGVPVQEVSEHTNFPEIMDGRVKTLHPRIFGGVLCRLDHAEDQQQAAAQGIEPIDLVVINFYPFAQGSAHLSLEQGISSEAVELIDIGGPALIRAAAKNYRRVVPLIDPEDYPKTLAYLQDGGVPTDFREYLSCKVWCKVAEYDQHIARFFAQRVAQGARRAAPMSDLISTSSAEIPLRYGENPQNTAKVYRLADQQECALPWAEALNDTPLSYNNYLDAEAAVNGCRIFDFTRPTVSIIKHTTPCGFAQADQSLPALELAWQGDPVSAFGGIVAFNHTMGVDAARFLERKFIELVAAPDFDQQAVEILNAKKNRPRLLRIQPPSSGEKRAPEKEFRALRGGLLEQLKDTSIFAADPSSPTKIPFPQDQLETARFGMYACRQLFSNAIVLVQKRADGSLQLVSCGGGQPNRIDAFCCLALPKACDRIGAEIKAQGGDAQQQEQAMREAMGSLILVSDAFFPFADIVEAAAEAGIGYICQPGGSKRDQDSIDACDRAGIAMLFSGLRHFRH